MYEIIVNPKARTGQGGTLRQKLEVELKKRKTDYKIYFTNARKHAEKLAAEITGDGKEHILLVLGGDGTLNEVVNGIYDVSKVTLGYIPVGSGNDFARGMGLAKESMNAIDQILDMKQVREINVGVAEQGGWSRRFLVSSGIGFDAAVCHEVCVSKWKVILNRLKLGKLSYAVVALDRLRKDKPVRMELQTEDGSWQEYPKTYFAAFMNLPYEGGGFKFCPDASPSDDLLDIMVISGLTKFKILCLLPTAFVGKHVLFRGVHILKAKEVHVKTDQALPIHTDGEPAFLRKEIRVSFLEKKMKVIMTE
nr:diacylglycerol kinase family protein [uncultured Mediterraneibacter sp.]